MPLSFNKFRTYMHEEHFTTKHTKIAKKKYEIGLIFVCFVIKS